MCQEITLPPKDKLRHRSFSHGRVPRQLLQDPWTQIWQMLMFTLLRILLFRCMVSSSCCCYCHGQRYLKTIQNELAIRIQDP
jgi:hypothetical protein